MFAGEAPLVPVLPLSRAHLVRPGLVTGHPGAGSAGASPWQCWECLALLEVGIVICGMEILSFLSFLACCLPTMDNI